MPDLPQSATAELAFPLSEFQSRLDEVRKNMAAQGLDALLLHAMDNLYYYSGYDGSIGGYLYTALIIRPAGPPTMLVHHVDLGTARWSSWVEDLRIWRHGEDAEKVLADLIRELGLDTARIGVEEQAVLVSQASDRALRRLLPKVRFIDVSDMLARQRLVMSPRELDYMRQSAQASNEACIAAYAAIAEGVSEREIAKAATDRQYATGSRWTNIFCMGTGPKSVALHSFGGKRRLKKGDAVTLVPHGDINHYVTSIHRTACVGPASDYLKELHANSAEAIARSVEAVKPGVPAGEIDRISREVTKKFDGFRCHRTGFSMSIQFGYGFKCMPKLSLLKGNMEALRAGMVLSIEPNFQDMDNSIGILLGNNYLVTETGCESLHSLSLDLYESA